MEGRAAVDPRYVKLRSRLHQNAPSKRSMILRRITSRLRDQEWIAFAIDFIIVVVGVFIGIQVSNLNSTRIDRELEREYVDRIVSDLDTITGTARDQIGFERTKSEQAIIALRLTQQPSSDQKSLRLGTVLSALTLRLSPNYESPTFSDLQNSGRLTLVKNPVLRNKLSNYFARLQYLRAAIRLNNDSFAESMVAYLRDEGIGTGWADPTILSGVPMSDLDRQLATLSRERFGVRNLTTSSSNLRLPPQDPFWERLRATISWRGSGTIANERILQMIVNDAAQMKRDVERDRAD